MHNSQEIQATRLNDSGDGIDLKKGLNMLIDNWYWFAIGAFIGLLTAFLFYRYTAPLYSINARVLVNDEQKGGGLSKQASSLMDLGGIVGSQSLVDNEVEILKTPDLIEKVVRSMNLNILYGQRINLISREIYNPPFNVSLLKEVDTIQSTRLKIRISKGDKISLETEQLDKEVSWNEAFHVPGVGTVKLVRRPGVKMTDAEYYADITSVDQRVANLIEQLSVEVSNNKVTIVDLRLHYPVQKKGEEILAALIAKYKSSNLEDKNAVADSTYSFIKERLNVIATELGDVETKVERFKKKNQLADMSEQGKLLVQNTGTVTADLAKAETQITILSDLEDYLKDETRNKRVFPTSLLPSDMVFTNLMEQYNSLLAEKDRTLMSVTEATPFVQNLNSQIVSLRRGILANIQSTKNTFVVSRNKLRTQLTAAQAEISDVPQIEKSYLQLARNQQIKQELYIFLMQKAEETAISKTSNISVAKVIAAPKAGVFPVSPKKSIFMVTGLFAGLLLPFIGLVIKSFLNTSVTSREDITGATQVPILGEISHNRTDDNMIVSNHGRSAVAEQFRALRSNLSFYLKNKNSSVILLTSSMSGEGKSFVAINLGNILALLGKKVLLMEMDLRKPGLSNKLDVKNDLGFSNYVIDDRLKAEDIIKPLKINENLFLMSSGPLPPNPVEILMSERSKGLIEELKGQFDYIIMDAPPIGIISDAQALVDYADITLYLVRQKVTKKRQLEIVEGLYRSGKIKNLSIIVNDVIDKLYGYGYGYGSYGEQQETGNWFTRLFKR
jgi:tyrosine-protein kinase Etk/Wzc